jgi:trigger factor
MDDKEKINKQDEELKQEEAQEEATPETEEVAPEPEATEEEVVEPVEYELVKEEDKPDSVKKFDIKVKGEIFKESLDEKLKDLKSEITIPGFRKGKAPMKLVEIQFGDAAKNETIEDIAPPIIQDVLKDRDLDVVGEPRLTNFEVADDNALTLEIEVEYIPTVDLVDEDYKGRDVEIVPVEVNDEMVEKYIDDFRWQNAMLEAKKKGSTYKKGDALVVSVEVKDEQGNEIEYLKKDNTLIRKPEDQLPKEGLTALKGKKAGESVEAAVPMERKDGEDKVVSKTDTWKITVQDIKTVKLPELDDDLAKDMGEFESLDDLRAKMKENLEKNAKDQERRQIVEKVFYDIFEKYKIEPPKGLVASHASTLAARGISEMEQQGFEVNADLKQRIYFSRAQEALHQILFWIINGEIKKRENIEASEEDINKELERMGEQMGRKALAVRASLERNKQFDQFVEDLTMKKVEDFVVEKVKVVYKKPEKAEKKPASKPKAKKSDTKEKKTEKEDKKKK